MRLEIFYKLFHFVYDWKKKFTIFCRGLLQKDPKRRFTHFQFFNHPFVDLSHAPSDKSLVTAETLAAKAIDSQRRRQNYEAFRLYCDAIDNFVAAIQWADTNEERERLRDKIKGYISRAESIKLSLTPGKGRVQHTDQENNESTELSVAKLNFEDSPPSTSRLKESLNQQETIMQVSALLFKSLKLLISSIYISEVVRRSGNHCCFYCR